MRKLNKKGEGLVGGLIAGVGALIIGVIVTLIVVSTLINANLLTGEEQGAATNLSSNLTAGISEVALKIPTIMLIAAVVLLFGVLVFLVARSKQMGIGGGGSL